jgi:hypothetical protein
LFSRLPLRDSLQVLSCHRIGKPDDDLFDACAFSATTEQFNEQITYLKRRARLITAEVLALKVAA